MYDEGINYIGDVLDLAALHDIIEKAGAWYAYAGEKIGQGRPAAIAYLKSNPKILAETVAQVKEATAEKTD